ncbi:MAG: glycerophosphodiester phosphodiesterase family protein [Novosphingobium sp.]
MPLFAPLDRLLVPAAAPERIGWIGAFTYAHRGLWGAGVPENSLAAFAAAAERGLGIELDARLASDGLAVVFHDHTLERMTAEQGLVLERKAEELGRVALEDSAEPIPSLRQALDLVASRVPILIELKCEHRTAVPALCAAVRRDIAAYAGPHAVMSFEPRVSRWFARHAPDVPRGLSFRASGRDRLPALVHRRLAFWRARPHFLTCDIAGLPLRLVAHQRARGLPLVAWTVTSAEQRATAKTYADALIAEGAGLG